MSTPVGDLFKQALYLDERDRATLGGLLLESLEQKVDEDSSPPGKMRLNGDWLSLMPAA